MSLSRIILTNTLLFAAALTAQAAPIYSTAFTPAEQDNWQVTRGEWLWSDDGLTNTKHGENRIFIDTLVGLNDYTVSLSANLHEGQGWGMFFGSNLDSQNKISGFNFQYDPGWGDGAYLIRKWDSDKESVLSSVRTDLDYDIVHDFLFQVSNNSITVQQDGTEIIRYNGLLEPEGTLLGLRTWSGSTASFTSMSVSGIPEPSTLLLLGISGMTVALRPRRVALQEV